MVEFLSPEVIIQEKESTAVPFLASSTSTTWMEHTAERGPINRSILVTGLQDWESIYGKDDGGYGRQSVVGFFNNGGRRLICNRVAHYADITDKGTLDPVAAELATNTQAAAATPASKTTNAGPWDLTELNGVAQPPTLITQIDGAGADTATIAATGAVVTAPGAPTGVAGTPGDTLDFVFPGGTQTVTLVGAPTTIDGWIAEISAQLTGAKVGSSGGALLITTDSRGSAAAVTFSATTSVGAAAVESGLGAVDIVGVNSGPNDVADLSAVTATELEAVLEADWVGGGGVDAIPQPDGSLIVNTVAVDVASSIEAVTGTAASVVVFDPAGLVTGGAAGAPSVPTLRFTASSEGSHGNLLSVTINRRDRVIAGIVTDIPAAPVTEVEVDVTSQFRVGLQFFIEDTVTTGTMRGIVSAIIGNRVVLKDPVTPTAAIAAANLPTVTKETFDVTFVIEGNSNNPYSDLSMDETDTRFYVGNVIGTDPTVIDPRQRMFVTDLGAPLSNDEDPRPVDVVEGTLAGGTDDSVPLTDADYIGSESTDTGLRAADAVDTEFSLLTVPGIELATVHKAIQDFAELKKTHLALIETPRGITPVQAKDYISVTANLFSTYLACYAGDLIVRRESTGNQETFPSVGYVAGVYATNDRENSVASPPAGVRKGRIKGAVGVGNSNVYASKPNRDLLYPEPGINAIWDKSGAGIVLWGQLTLDPNSDRGTIGVRRALLALEKDIQRLSDFVLFELNTEELRQDYKTRVSGYLNQQWKAGVIQGSSANEAFYIKCDEENNPPSVINSRQFFADIGVNVIPAIDYAVITIRRDTRALEAELAAA
jgi:hypothetical protein